jgi:tetratricopeptide (TPR) repeat protein
MTRHSLGPRSLFVLAVLLAAASPVAAQKGKEEPRRPALAADADTNDARAYYDFGLAKLEREPDKAADAFYWATRLNPTWADAYYARRSALLLSDRYRFQKYYEDDRRTLQSDAIKRIDSLYFYSLTINPFLYRRLDVVLFRQYWRGVADEYARRNNVSSTEVQYYLERWLERGPASLRAWQAYGEGRFPDALRLYADAIKQARYKAGHRTSRGRLFFQLDQADSALKELTQALDEMRRADSKDLVFIYESKALLEHSIGLVQKRLGHVDAAKESFGRALQEDLSYFPAHVELGYLAIEAKDTTTALSEMELAVQIRADDPALRFILGYTLYLSGKYADAEEHLRKALELDPVYAAPHHVLGQVLDQQGKTAAAREEYRTFLALASRIDLRRSEAEERLRVLAERGGE